MHHLGQQGFWPTVEANDARRPRADPDRTLTTSPRRSDSFLDGEKTGAALLLSGALLALVGVTFTVIGWKHYRGNLGFEWTQLLGPILISVGGTFILTSVCKFCIISCWPCAQRQEEDEEDDEEAATEIPARPQTSRDGPFLFCGINQPVVLQSSTGMLCIPPAYNFINQEARRPVSSMHGGVHLAGPPPYDAVFCVENAAFAAEEENSAGSTETDQRRRSTQNTEEDRGRRDGGGSTCSRPPAYEDIYPSFHKHGPT
ncbi:transmembrane protein 174 [Mugil cephalus]|uniref:transmembrane protein 174 n=1 Tax=Mugil cephalus TaxID=48193 RepID=UPI001FB608D8|nr:transmembrane protein 174 [Mugil cephalus]